MASLTLTAPHKHATAVPFQSRNQQLREAKQLVQGHTARHQRSCRPVTLYQPWTQRLHGLWAWPGDWQVRLQDVHNSHWHAMPSTQTARRDCVAGRR